MKRDTKIFITCLVFSLWSINLGMVNLSKASHSNDYYDMVVGVLGMSFGGILIYYGLKDNVDDTD